MKHEPILLQEIDKNRNKTAQQGRFNIILLFSFSALTCVAFRGCAGNAHAWLTLRRWWNLHHRHCSDVAWYRCACWCGFAERPVSWSLSRTWGTCASASRCATSCGASDCTVPHSCNRICCTWNKDMSHEAILLSKAKRWSECSINSSHPGLGSIGDTVTEDTEDTGLLSNSILT